MSLLLSGELNQHLHEVDEECHRQMDCLVESMKKWDGVTEKLKKENQMLWVQRMNGILAAAEEMVLNEWVYV